MCLLCVVGDCFLSGCGAIWLRLSVETVQGVVHHPGFLRDDSVGTAAELKVVDVDCSVLVMVIAPPDRDTVRSMDCGWRPYVDRHNITTMLVLWPIFLGSVVSFICRRVVTYRLAGIHVLCLVRRLG